MNANTRALIAIIVINFVTIAGFGFMFPVFAIYGKAIDANATEIALSIASFSLGQLIASPLWGKISDRYGRRNVLVISLLVGAVLTALNVFAVTPWLLIFARFICGLASGSFSVAFAVAADISNAENRTRVMGMVGAGFSLGFILGPAIGGFAAGNDPGVDAFARVCIAGAAMMGFGGILTLFILPETRKRHEPSADATPVAVRSNLTLLRDPTLAFPIILSLITSLALSKMESTFAIFADDVLHLPPSRIGLIFAVMGTIGAIVQFAGAGLLAKKLGERGMLMLALCFLTVGMFVVGSSTALPQAILGMCIIASGFSTVNPALSGLTSLAASADEQGSALGVMQSAASFGRVAGPALAGLIYDFAGPSAPFMLAGVVLALTLVSSFAVLRARVA